jgi:excisionase family DNA binding protein
MDTHAQLLTPTEAARLLGVSRRHLLRLPLKRIRIGHRTVRYRLEDMEEFLSFHVRG